GHGASRVGRGLEEAWRPASAARAGCTLRAECLATGGAAADPPAGRGGWRSRGDRGGRSRSCNAVAVVARDYRRRTIAEFRRRGGRFARRDAGWGGRGGTRRRAEITGCAPRLDRMPAAPGRRAG